MRADLTRPVPGSKWPVKRLLCGLVVLLALAGCNSLLPRSTNVTSQFREFEDLRNAVESLEPKKTDQATLVRLGIDPSTLPNTTVLSYTDILRRFVPGSAVSKDELDAGIVDCLNVRDACRGWELNVVSISRDRTGSFLADIFNFRRRTITTGWRFNATILLANGIVVYRSWGGQPSVNMVDVDINPLGPLQNSVPALLVSQ